MPVLALPVFHRTGWLSYYKIFKMPVLVSLNPADTARAMEKQTDKKIVEDALQVIPLELAALGGAATGLALEELGLTTLGVVEALGPTAGWPGVLAVTDKP
jgi:hypothetical protein